MWEIWTSLIWLWWIGFGLKPVFATATAASNKYQLLQKLVLLRFVSHFVEIENSFFRFLARVILFYIFSKKVKLIYIFSAKFCFHFFFYKRLQSAVVHERNKGNRRPIYFPKQCFFSQVLFVLFLVFIKCN